MKTMYIVITIFILWSHSITTGQVFAEENTLIMTFTDEDWTPIIYTDNNNPSGHNGLFVELLNEVFINRMNKKLEYKPLPWKRAQIWIKNGMADLMITIPTENRLEYAIQSDDPIFELYMHVYTYKDHDKIEEIKQIKSAKDILQLGLIPVTNLGNGWYEENIGSYGIKTYYARQEESLAKILAAKRADIMIDTFIPMNYKIKQLGLASKIEVTDVRFGPVKFHLLMSKKSKYIGLIPEINKTIKSMIEDGTLAKITNKYAALE